MKSAKEKEKAYVYAIRIERNFYDDDWEPGDVTSSDMDVPRYGKRFMERAYTTLDAANADFDKLLKKVEFVDPCSKDWRKIDKKVDDVVECKPAGVRDIRWVDVYTDLGDDCDESVCVMTLRIVKVELISKV